MIEAAFVLLGFGVGLGVGVELMARRTNAAWQSERAKQHEDFMALERAMVLAVIRIATAIEYIRRQFEMANEDEDQEGDDE